MMFRGALLVCMAVGVLCQDATTPSPTGNSPANTRFLPGLDNIVGGALNFLDPCSRCNFQNQQFASQCCQRGNRQCCRFVQPVGPPIGGFPGQFGPQFPGGGVGVVGGGVGVVGGSQFNQFGPPGVGGGLKPGVCPQLGGVSAGFGRFGGSQCVAECQSDFQCAGVQKCCQVGCSSICRNPQGVQNFGPTQQVVKPGFCPRTGISALLLGRSAAADTTTAGQPGVETFLEGDNVAMSGRQARKEERRRQRKEEKAASRTKRQVDNRDDFRNDRRNRRLNRLNRLRGRVIRQVDNRDDFRNDRRNRRLNRLNRLRGRVIRQAPSTAAPNSDPNTRFFPLPGIPGIKNPFCNNDCFNDADCLGRLKCCVDEGECRRCVDPVPF